MITLAFALFRAPSLGISLFSFLTLGAGFVPFGYQLPMKLSLIILLKTGLVGKKIIHVRP